MTKKFILFLLVFGLISCDSDKDSAVQVSSESGQTNLESVFFRLRVFDSQHEESRLQSIDIEEFNLNDILLVFTEEPAFAVMNIKQANSYSSDKIKNVNIKASCRAGNADYYLETSKPQSNFYFHEILPREIQLWPESSITCDFVLVAKFMNSATNSINKRIKIKNGGLTKNYLNLHALDLEKVASGSGLYCFTFDRRLVQNTFYIQDLKSCRYVEGRDLSPLYINTDSFGLEVYRSEIKGYKKEEKNVNPRFSLRLANKSDTDIEILVANSLGVFSSYISGGTAIYSIRSGDIVLQAPAQKRFILRSGEQVQLDFKSKCEVTKGVAPYATYWGNNIRLEDKKVSFRIANLTKSPFYAVSYAPGGVNIKYVSDTIIRQIRTYPSGYERREEVCISEP